MQDEDVPEPILQWHLQELRKDKQIQLNLAQHQVWLLLLMPAPTWLTMHIPLVSVWSKDRRYLKLDRTSTCFP